MTASALVPAAFDMAGDIAAMTPRLAPLVGHGTAITAACLLDRKDGRALFRYDLAGPDRTVSTVLAKLYADVAQAARVHRTMGRLHDEVFAGVPGLGVPRALGVLAEPVMVVYEPVPGVPLQDLPSPSQRVEAGRRAGHWLAVLHASGVDLDRRLDPARETANCVVWAATVDRALGQGATRAGDLARKLGPRALDLDIRTDRPMHKDFHHEHVLTGISAGAAPQEPPSVAVIDLDEARLGDPAYDVAHFCANLWLLSLRGVVGDWEEVEIEKAFLGSYIERTGWSADFRFDLFRAVTCVKLAKQIATGRGPAPRPSGNRRAAEAYAIVEQGQAWLA